MKIYCIYRVYDVNFEFGYERCHWSSLSKWAHSKWRSHAWTTSAAARTRTFARCCRVRATVRPSSKSIPYHARVRFRLATTRATTSRSRSTRRLKFPLVNTFYKLTSSARLLGMLDASRLPLTLPTIKEDLCLFCI